MRCVIIGAGPTGLGAAWRCEQSGVDWVLYERNAAPGGLSASLLVDGFTWDLGGHVVFSHYRLFDRMLDRVLSEGEWLRHERRAFVRLLDRWVPYPFQNNIRHLPPAEREECLAGLREAARQDASKPAADFQEWIDRSGGRGIARLFLNPYNFKVWAYPPRLMSAGWLGDRVAKPDLAAIERRIKEEADEVSWGPNRWFRFPARGGTGEIWRRLAATLPAERLRYDQPVDSVDLSRRTVRTRAGETAGYDFLISTLPLDDFLLRWGGGLARHAAMLTHNSVHLVGVGLRGPAPKDAQDKTWLYFPEVDCPFYRVTVFSNYSPNNVPEGCYSLMAEVAESPFRPVASARVAADCIRALRRTGLIGEANEVVHTWQRRLPRAYPVPTLPRDEALAAALPELERQGVLSRGRFGAWKYEVGNMDHCFAQGVEAVDHMVSGAPEVTLNDPDRVNRGQQK